MDWSRNVTAIAASRKAKENQKADVANTLFENFKRKLTYAQGNKSATSSIRDVASIKSSSSHKLIHFPKRDSGNSNRKESGSTRRRHSDASGKKPHTSFWQMIKKVVRVGPSAGSEFANIPKVSRLPEISGPYFSVHDDVASGLETAELSKHGLEVRKQMRSDGPVHQRMPPQIRHLLKQVPQDLDVFERSTMRRTVPLDRLNRTSYSERVSRGDVQRQWTESEDSDRLALEAYASEPEGGSVTPRPGSPKVPAPSSPFPPVKSGILRSHSVGLTKVTTASQTAGTIDETSLAPSFDGFRPARPQGLRLKRKSSGSTSRQEHADEVETAGSLSLSNSSSERVASSHTGVKTLFEEIVDADGNLHDPDCVDDDDHRFSFESEIDDDTALAERRGKHVGAQFERNPAPDRQVPWPPSDDKPSDDLRPAPFNLRSGSKRVFSEQQHGVKQHLGDDQGHPLSARLPTRSPSLPQKSASRSSSTSDLHQHFFQPFETPESESRQEHLTRVQKQIAYNVNAQSHHLGSDQRADSSTLAAQDEHPRGSLTGNSGGPSTAGLSDPETVFPYDAEESADRRRLLEEEEDRIRPLTPPQDRDLRSTPTFGENYARMARNNDFPYDPMPENSPSAPAKLQPKSSGTVRRNSHRDSMYDLEDEAFKRVLAERPLNEENGTSRPSTPRNGMDDDFLGSERGRPLLRKKRSFTEVIKDTLTGISNKVSPAIDRFDPQPSSTSVSKSGTHSPLAIKHDHPILPLPARERQASDKNIGQAVSTSERAQLDEDFTSFKLTLPAGHEQQKLREKGSVAGSLRKVYAFGKKENQLPDSSAIPAQSPGQVILAQNTMDLPRPKTSKVKQDIKIKVESVQEKDEPKAELKKPSEEAELKKTLSNERNKAPSNGEGQTAIALRHPIDLNLKAIVRPPDKTKISIPEGQLCCSCDLGVSKERKKKNWRRCGNCSKAWYCGKECRKIHQPICDELRCLVKEINFSAGKMMIERTTAGNPSFYRTVWKHFNYFFEGFSDELHFKKGCKCSIILWLSDELDWDPVSFSNINGEDKMGQCFEVIIRRVLNCPVVPLRNFTRYKHPFHDRDVHQLNLWCDECRGVCAGCGDFCCIHEAICSAARVMAKKNWRANVEFHACMLLLNDMIQWLDKRRLPNGFIECPGCADEGLTAEMQDEYCWKCWEVYDYNDGNAAVTEYLCGRHFELAKKGQRRKSPGPIDLAPIRDAIEYANIHPVHRPGAYPTDDGDAPWRWRSFVPPGSSSADTSAPSERSSYVLSIPGMAHNPETAQRLARLAEQAQELSASSDALGMNAAQKLLGVVGTLSREERVVKEALKARAALVSGRNRRPATDKRTSDTATPARTVSMDKDEAQKLRELSSMLGIDEDVLALARTLKSAGVKPTTSRFTIDSDRASGNVTPTPTPLQVATHDFALDQHANGATQ